MDYDDDGDDDGEDDRHDTEDRDKLPNVILLGSRGGPLFFHGFLPGK